MKLLKRINDIVSANLNDMVDDFENPERMLRQAIREMERSIAQATQETSKALAGQKLLEREAVNNRAQATQWQHRAEQAIDAGDDDLARKALRRKQEHDRLTAALQDQLNSAIQATDSLKRQLEAMKAKLTEAKRSLAVLSARQRAADFRKRAQVSVSGSLTQLDQDAFAKFDRLRARVEQAEAEAEAVEELLASCAADPPDKPAFDEDEHASIEKTLARLKESRTR